MDYNNTHNKLSRRRIIALVTAIVLVFTLYACLLYTSCHSRDVKVYLTLNTLIRQEELTPVMAVVEQACGLGIDALIIQDLGLAALVRRAAPDLSLIHI